MLATHTYHTIAPVWRAERELLIFEYLPQVRIIARRLHRKLPETIALEDLVSAGTTGLIAAIDNFDDERHIKLKTYAEFKIKGAILDSLRSLDWASRKQRRRGRLVKRAVAALEQELGRTPEGNEVAAHLQIGLDEYYSWTSQLQGSHIESLEKTKEEDSPSRQVADVRASSPSDLFENAELRRALERAVESIPANERSVIALHFFEDWTLREIAQSMGLHESRISQLKTRAIQRLQVCLLPVM